MSEQEQQIREVEGFTTQYVEDLYRTQQTALAIRVTPAEVRDAWITWDKYSYTTVSVDGVEYKLGGQVFEISKPGYMFFQVV